MAHQTAQELQSFVRRIESVEDEIFALNADKSAIYKEAKGAGFTPKTLRKVVAKRRIGAAERGEQDAEFDLYWNAVHGIDPDLVRAHVEIIDEFPVGHDEDGVFPDDEPRDPVPQASAQTVAVPSAPNSPVESEAVAISTPINEPQSETAAQMQTGRNQSKASPDRAESIADGRSNSVANTLGDAGFIDPIGYETAINSQPTPSVATGEHVPLLTVLSRTHTLETANENADVRAHDAPHVEDDSAAVDGAPLTSDSQANTGGQNEDPSRTEHVTLDRRPGPTAPDEGQNGSEHQRAEHPETYTAPVGRVADESPTPFYAEPGEVVMEACPPVGIVVHPYAACWPVNTVDVGDGVREPVVKIGHLILDGRGRYYAARQANVEYPVVQYDGDDDLADNITWNLASRPSTDQRALRIVAEKLAKLVPDRAEEIMERFGFNEAQEAAQ